MERVERYSQAYSQAPWRKQVQLLGLFLLIVVFMALVAGPWYRFCDFSNRADPLSFKRYLLNVTACAFDMR